MRPVKTLPVPRHNFIGLIRSGLGPIVALGPLVGYAEIMAV